MRTNVIGVRWQGGNAFVGDPVGFRIESFQSHAGDGEQIVAKALAEIATYQDGQVETTAVIDVMPADPQPGDDWVEGDVVTVTGVGETECAAQTFTVSNDTGRVDCVPQFGTVLDDSDERADRTLALIGGLAKGTSRLARPVAPGQSPNIRP